MLDLREKLRKAAGLFIELPPEEQSDERDAVRERERPTATVEEIVRESDGPNLDAISVPAIHAATEPTALSDADGRLDFSPVYESAGLPPAPFTAEQAVEMLRSLPAELPLAMRRQTMGVALNAMGKSIGATPESIVADASRKLAALAAYGESLSRKTAESVANAELEIAALQAQIAAKKQEIADAQQGMAQTLAVCHSESDRLDDVLEFFSLDVPPSKHAAVEL